jgi:2-dehydro-3-deoxygluconokinase
MRAAAGAPDVLAIGETMALLAPRGAQSLETTDELRLDIGGAESNVASHLARVGVSSAWAGAVGDDPLGRRVVATLRARGVDTSWVAVDPAAPTGVYFKDPNPAGTRVSYYRSGSAASRLGPEFADRLPLDEVGLVHLTGITLALSASNAALVDRVLERRRSAGLPVSFDVNYRPALWPDAATAAAALLSAAQRADIVFVGRDEAEALWGTATAAGVRALLSGCPMLVVKDAERGAHAFGTGDDVVLEPEPVEVVEPVGAGDAFAAGYLAATLAGTSRLESLRAGHRAAARVLISTIDY